MSMSMSSSQLGFRPFVQDFQGQAKTSVYIPQAGFSRQLPPPPPKGLIDQSLERTPPVDLDTVYFFPGYLREVRSEVNSFQMGLDATVQEVLHNKVKMLWQQTGKLPGSQLIFDHLTDYERIAIFLGHEELSYENIVWLSQHDQYPLNDERYSNLNALNFAEFKGDINEFAAIMMDCRNTFQITKIRVGPTFTKDCFQILLSVCPNLRSIDFSLWNTVSDDVVEVIAQKYPDLEALILSESKFITKKTLEIIESNYLLGASCKLKHFAFYTSGMPQTGMARFVTMAGSRNVCIINPRSSCEPFKDAWVYAGNLNLI